MKKLICEERAVSHRRRKLKLIVKFSFKQVIKKDTVALTRLTGCCQRLGTGGITLPTSRSTSSISGACANKSSVLWFRPKVGLTFVRDNIRRIIWNRTIVGVRYNCVCELWKGIPDAN